ncbi:hypothetical protein C2S51_002712, partial [Perilla frutescens var. frutescens]
MANRGHATNYDENEDTEIVKKLVDLKAELRQSFKEKLESDTSSYESRMNEFIPPVRAAIKHYLSQECIGRRKISKRGEQEHITCTTKRRRQNCLQESMDLSLSNQEYGKLDFLRENKEEEKLYSNNNVKEKIASIMLRNFKHKSSLPLKNAASEYLLHVQLDTSVAQEFCCLLSKTFQEKNVKIIDPLCWQSKMQKEAQSKSVQPINAKNYDKVLIGVIANNHFFSIHVHVNEHQIFILDSMARDSREFYDAHFTVLLNDMLFHDEISEEGWKIFRVNNSPQQDNAYDCGVFMLKTMEYWAKGEKLPFAQ